MSDDTHPPTRPWFQHADHPPARARPVEPRGSNRAIDPEALTAAASFVVRVASEHAGALFRTIVEMRLDRPEAVLHETGLAVFLSGLGPDEHEAEEQLRAADRAFNEAFGVGLVLEEHLAVAGKRSFFLAAELAAVIDGVIPEAAKPTHDGPMLDATTTRWMTIAAAAARSGRSHHLALRADGPEDPSLSDFAAAMARADVNVLVIGASERPGLALLRCELHGGPHAALVVADCDVLGAAAAPDEDACWDGDVGSMPAEGLPLRVRTSFKRLLPALAEMRNTYVWRVPDGRPPREFARMIGGRIGPVALDASWSLSKLLEAWPPLGAEGARRLLAAVGDDAAARLEEERRTVLLEIEEGALAHLALRAGIVSAEAALRLYRERHRSSMMENASAIFRKLTRGTYDGLVAQGVAGGEVLVGLLAGGGSRLAPEMSTATRNQLYLALRMAGHAEYARSRRPPPFVLDDVLETFDDRRAEAALAQLAALASTGQVVYLTHHQHLCDIVRRICPAASIQEIAPT